MLDQVMIGQGKQCDGWDGLDTVWSGVTKFPSFKGALEAEVNCVGRV